MKHSTELQVPAILNQKSNLNPRQKDFDEMNKGLIYETFKLFQVHKQVTAFSAHG